MIPLKLQLKNFLSYGPTVQTIDFSPYQLICLSGKNGHGKSALLDAITWAVWGQARKVSNAPKADANLVRLGQTQMMVCLDFICNGQTYRVRREYTKTYGKPLATLDFGILNTDDDTVVSLTDKTIRTTQQKLERTINLTFDAFTNSAFLRQGEANEFSKKSPKERKEIFAQILGLQQYEAVRKRAMEKAKEAATQKSCILAFQEKLQGELGKADNIDAQIKKLTHNLNTVTREQNHINAEHKKLDEEKKQWAQQKKQQELLQFQLKELCKKETELNKALTDVQREWKKVETVQQGLPDQATLEKKKKHLVDAITQHQKILQQRLELQEQQLKHNIALQQLEKKIHEQQATETHKKQVAVERLQLTLEASTEKQKELTAQLQAKQDEQKQRTQAQQKITKELANYAIDEKQFQRMEQQLVQGKEKYQELITRGNLARQELSALEQKEKLSHDDNNPSCPLCEQNLSASRKRFLKTKFAQQKKELHQYITQLAIDVQNLKKELLTHHATLKQQRTTREENAIRTTQANELTRQITTLDAELKTMQKQIEQAHTLHAQTEKELIHAQKELHHHQEQNKQSLAQDSSHQKLQTACTTIHKKLEQLVYNERKHKTASEALHTIEQQLATCAQLHAQQALQQERKKQIDTLSATIQQTNEQKMQLHKKLEPYNNLAQQESELKEREHKLSSASEQLASKKETLLQQQGSLENQKNKIKTVQQEYKAQQKTVCELNDVAEDYFEIAAATSKNGIQALLIENAIPEVEQEANRLLGKLTNNQAQLFIESLRDLKKGGTKETLDIKISDTAGIRPYELFSGGEAFRIDFALRIAISKLLARRAGTSLQTLIIDEGFGSQDEEGLAQIMDAIHKIQDDFLKVIIVSHLTSIKDQFPVHFVVEKGASGSRVTIVELG